MIDEAVPDGTAPLKGPGEPIGPPDVLGTSEPRLDRSSALFLVVVLALAGASTVNTIAPVAVYAWSITTGRPPVSSFAMAFIWAWAGLSTVAVSCGLSGGYHAISSGVINRALILAFLVPFAIVLRIDQVSLGWPLQFHLGMVVGRVGMGVNLVGILLLFWLSRLRRLD